MKLIRKLLLLIMLAAQAVQAEPVLVVHPQSPIEKITHEDLVNVYMGRYRRLPNGIVCQPIDQGSGPSMADFYKRLVNKSLYEINAYWARQFFSGKNSPPASVGSAKELEQMLQDNPNAIGYLDRKEVSNRMRIVFEFDK